MRTAWVCIATATLWLCASLATVQGAALLDDQNVVSDLIRAATTLYQERKLDESLNKFQEVIKLDADNLIANQYMALINAQLGRFKPAIDLIRKLQGLGVSIYVNQDSKMTLGLTFNGVLHTKDLKQRGDLLIHFRETIQGLPAELERQIDANLMAIYAKTGETTQHDVVEKRYFANKPVPGEAYFVAARTYLEYEVNLPLAANYFEQAVETLRSRPIQSTGNPEQDAFLARRRGADTTVAEDFLAYTYYAAKILDPQKNRFLASESNPKTTFLDVTEAAGLKDVAGPRVAVGDFDNDGFDDLCFCGRLFKNVNGKTFKDVTKEARVDPTNVLAALWLDYDNDGNLDLLCASYPNVRLWRNLGNGVFEDVTLKAGLDYAFPGAPEALAAADYDGDGFVDLFIGCFEHPQQPARGQPDFLFHNNGRGRFEDQSRLAGMSGGQSYCARGAAWADCNNDGRPDLYVANYRLQPNLLWVNQGKGQFTEEAQALGVRGAPGRGRYAAAFGHSIGCAWGDIDNDGNLDLVVTNLALVAYMEFAESTALYLNRGKKDSWRFENITDASGIRYEEMATDPALVDFDNDGDLDLSITAVYKERPNALYQNVGGNKFQPCAWRAGVVAFNNWGQAWFDKDNDGDMDLVFGSASGVRLFENQARDTSWLRLRLVGRKSNRLGIGSRVSVAAGALGLVREVTAGTGSSSQTSPVAHFGLGSHRGTLDITVRWPDGHEQSVAGSAINQLVTIEEKEK